MNQSIFSGHPQCVVEPMLFSRSDSVRNRKLMKNAKSISCGSAHKVIQRFIVDSFYTDLLGHHAWVLVLYCQEMHIPFTVFFGLDSRIIVEVK